MIIEINFKNHNLFLYEKRCDLIFRNIELKRNKKWYGWLCKDCNSSMFTLKYNFNIFYINDGFVSCNDLLTCSDVIVKSIIE